MWAEILTSLAVVLSGFFSKMDMSYTGIVKNKKVTLLIGEFIILAKNLTEGDNHKKEIPFLDVWYWFRDIDFIGNSVFSAVEWYHPSQ